FSLSRSISLLYLCTAGLNGLLCMHFRRTGSSAAAVPSGTSAQQNDNITRIRVFTDYRTSWRSTQNCSDFHTFCHIVGMVDFFYIARSKSDLVSIGRITGSSAAHQLFLRQFAFHS